MVFRMSVILVSAVISSWGGFGWVPLPFSPAVEVRITGGSGNWEPWGCGLDSTWSLGSGSGGSSGGCGSSGGGSSGGGCGGFCSCCCFSCGCSSGRLGCSCGDGGSSCGWSCCCCGGGIGGDSHG